MSGEPAPGGKGPGRRRVEPWPVRWYRGLLILLPLALRERFGRETGDVFAELYREARGEGGRWAAMRIWMSSSAQVLVCAVASRTEGPGNERTSAAGRGVPRGNTGRGGGGMGTLWQDLRYGARTIVRKPGFALTAILILAAGIGATTTIFSVVDTVLLRPLPYPDAGRLVFFDEGAHSYPSLRAWQEMSSFQTVVAARDQQMDMTGDGAPERLDGAMVSADFFNALGAAPHLGRLFDARDYPGDGSVAVLGYGFWRNRFGGDPSVIGRTLQLDGRPVEVVGVLGAAFSPPTLLTGPSVALWFPLDDGGEYAEAHGFHALGVAGRLKPEVTVEAAQGEVDAQRYAIAREIPDNYTLRDGTVGLTPLVELREATVRGVAGTLWIVLGAVGVLLMIACANVANLFLARGTARTREIALRGALGASSGRIARQVLTESVLIAMAGGLAGVALAYGGVELITRFATGDVPRLDQVAVDGRALGFTVLVSLATGILFGWIPAMQATKRNTHAALKDGSGSLTAARAGLRLRNGLIVVEMGLAMVLLIGGGLLARSLLARLEVDPGFDTERLVVLPLALDPERDVTERAIFVRELIERVRELPGTREVAGGWGLPFSRTGGNRCCWRTTVTGDPALQNPEAPSRSLVHPVTEGYFSALRAPVSMGRDFEAADMAADAAVAILNRETALELFGTDAVVGRTITLGRDEPLTVIGVVAGVHHWGLDQPVEHAVYVPYGRFGGDFWGIELAIRTDASLGAFAPALREAVWALDANLPIPRITTMDDQVAASLVLPKFMSGLLGTFALTALLLACGGIYGSMLYSVRQRTRELGIRLALGADRSGLLTLVLAQGARLALGGVVLGTVAGLAVTGVMERVLWGVEPTDPLTFAIVGALLAGSAVAASLLPAWIAAGTDPLETLKGE